jgi:small neutral amino acid transporter SnatA (MarC family)
MKKFGIAIASFAFPLIAGAQTASTAPNLGYFETLIKEIGDIFNVALPIIIAGGVVYFVYGIAVYVMSGDDGAKEKAKDKIIYGIVGLFVMISVWGLVRLLGNITGINTAANNTAPTVNILPKI